MTVGRRKMSATGFPVWMPLFLMLACNLVYSVSSELVTSAIDASGDVENLNGAKSGDDKTKKKSLDLANAQIDWLISKGGTFDHEKVKIRPVSEVASPLPFTMNAGLGLFAAGDIEKGDILMQIPVSAVIINESGNDACDAALAMMDEQTKKGNASDFSPYLDYMFDPEVVPSIPATWSEVGKTLLKAIQGPIAPQDILNMSFFEDCIDKGDDVLTKLGDEKKLLFETAYVIARTRSWSEKMVPLVDMINHHPKMNIITSTKKNDDGDYEAINVIAYKDIDAGEQLLTTYRFRDANHYVPTLLQDYGFVEGYPQRWVLPTPPKRSNIEENKIPAEIKFEVVPTGGDDNQSYRVNWIDPRQGLAHPLASGHLKKELSRIRELDSLVVKATDDIPSESEKEIILEYYRSMITAYETVISSIEKAIESRPALVENAGDDFMACSDFEAIHDRDYGWFHYDSSRSSHQSVDYYYTEERRDACLFLEEYLHACVSNRPHYHEVFVHYPAHFLEKVERVLFIGGGDSMVLHEVLKYEDELELVVGLELDQHVVRETYSHIGTQPHFDNDKVEWWFGDAAEALNVLPTEYYGTFDLVVVDILTEVAESLRVNENVTIIEAAMMLMKPNGVIVKNEDEGYVPGSTTSAKYTDYTTDIMYYDVPLYCLQTFVVGSNAIDFSKTKPIDHKISNFYLKGVDEFQGQFDTWYTTGNATEDVNNDEEEVEVEKKKVDEEYDNEPYTASGLTVIIEAEQISVPMSMTSASDIQQIIQKCAETVGFTVDKSFNKDITNGFTLISLLEEGVISARCFPEKKYCALDVQLWKSAHKAESIKKELLLGLESKENSVFRVVTGTVYGTEENDYNDKIGPPSETTPNPSSTSQDDTGKPEIGSGVQTTFVKRKDAETDFKNATMDDYDSVSALAQWYSQDPLAHQVILRFELPMEYSLEKIEVMVPELIYDTLDEIKEQWEIKTSDQIMVEGFKVGVGFVAIATWSEGSVVAVWDGADLYQMTIFSLERSAASNAAALIPAFREYFKSLSADVFPRGTGRVINFRREFTSPDDSDEKERFRPLWAPPKTNSEVKG